MGSSVVKIGQDITEKEISSFLQEKENKLKFQNKVKEFEAALNDFSTKTDQDKNLAAIQGYEEGYVTHDFQMDNILDRLQCRRVGCSN